jgi:hypothetical protein
MTMTKTQAALLKEAADSMFGRITCVVSLNTARRTNRKHGTLRRSTASALRDTGHLEFIRSSEWTDYGYAGATIHCYESEWRITEAGRAAAIQAEG